MNLINKAHGIMFHHFHNEHYQPSQGSITAEQLEQIILYYKKNYNILNAQDWYNKSLTGGLETIDVCLTFDDALLCQYDIALPVLKSHNLTAFWFVYTSVIEGGYEYLEIYRKFRTLFYKEINDFYNDFFANLQKSTYATEVNQKFKNYDSNSFLAQFPFYSDEDKKFRYIRDVCLGNESYQNIMTLLLEQHNIDLQEFTADLWLSKRHLKDLTETKHIIGLHSHTHPTRIGEMEINKQEIEYKSNFKSISEITGEKPLTMSHPCNSYNKNTMSLLNELGIKLGFRANMEEGYTSKFEFPREDHANIIGSL